VYLQSGDGEGLWLSCRNKGEFDLAEGVAGGGAGTLFVRPQCSYYNRKMHFSFPYTRHQSLINIRGTDKARG